VGLEPDTVTFDAADQVRVATFWASALGEHLVDRGPGDGWSRGEL
jgi:hypothetical protein